jgi:hypothetical protein
MRLLATSQFYFRVLRVEVSRELFQVFISIKWEREDGDLHRSSIILFVFHEKIDFYLSHLCCSFGEFQFSLRLCSPTKVLAVNKGLNFPLFFVWTAPALSAVNCLSARKLRELLLVAWIWLFSPMFRFIRDQSTAQVHRSRFPQSLRSVWAAANSCLFACRVFPHRHGVHQSCSDSIPKFGIVSRGVSSVGSCPKFDFSPVIFPSLLCGSCAVVNRLARRSPVLLCCVVFAAVMHRFVHLPCSCVWIVAGTHLGIVI